MRKLSVRALAAAVTTAALPILLMTVVAMPVRADNDNTLTQEERRQIQIGLKIAPVPLKTAGKDAASISMGSFLVNVLADCKCQQFELVGG